MALPLCLGYHHCLHLAGVRGWMWSQCCQPWGEERSPGAVFCGLVYLVHYSGQCFPPAPRAAHPTRAEHPEQLLPQPGELQHPSCSCCRGLLLSLMSHPLCHPQLEGLCSFLQLSTCPEPFLVRFCSWLLALTPDLSYTSAAILAEQLFLRRVRARPAELPCSPFLSPLSPPPAFSVPRSCP